MQMQAQKKKKRIEEGEGKGEQLDKNYVEECLEEWEGRGGGCHCIELERVPQEE